MNCNNKELDHLVVLHSFICEGNDKWFKQIINMIKTIMKLTEFSCDYCINDEYEPLLAIMCGVSGAKIFCIKCKNEFNDFDILIKQNNNHINKCKMRGDSRNKYNMAIWKSADFLITETYKLINNALILQKKNIINVK